MAQMKLMVSSFEQPRGEQRYGLTYFFMDINAYD